MLPLRILSRGTLIFAFHLLFARWQFTRFSLSTEPLVTN
jgi:hypothetical protein